MQIKNRRYQSPSRFHCLIPEIVRNSQLMLNLNNTEQPDIEMNDLNTNVSKNSNTILNSTADQTDLLTFVKTFPINSPNFSRPSPRPLYDFASWAGCPASIRLGSTTGLENVPREHVLLQREPFHAKRVMLNC